MVDDSFAVCRRRCWGRFCEKVEDLETRVDLFIVAVSRLSEGLDVLGNLRVHAELRLCDGGDPDVFSDPHDCAEPLLGDDEDLDASGDSVEDAKETPVAAGTDEDDKDRPVRAMNLLSVTICDDVF